MFWNKKQVEVKFDETYIGLRNQAFSILPSDLNLILEPKQHQVYAAIVDMPIAGKMATLVCMFDGTTSLYFSHGGGILGSGQKHELIRKTAGDFLFSCGQVIPFMQPTKDFSLPLGKETVVYLKCGEGVFMTHMNLEEKQSEKYKEFLSFLIQRIISAFRDGGEL